MQKILIVSSKGISSHNFDGAQKRIFDIAKYLSKKNKVDFACIESENFKVKNNFKFFSKIVVFQINLFSRIFNSLISIIKLQPIQNGFFFSKNLSDYVLNNQDDYDVIIFHLIRSAQYLPDNFIGKTILEMTDLGSENYKQIIKKMSLINPLKYLYFLEKILLSNYEKKLSNSFDKVVFISNNEISITKDFIHKDKVAIIGTSKEINKKLYKYKKNNNEILFVGNINYLPNKLACYDFAKNILPKLNKNFPNLKLNIVGKINFLDKFLLNLNKNIKISGPVLKLDKIVKKSICGICNLSVATGVQNKIFTYMSYGLPSVISKKSYLKYLIKKNKETLVYSNEKEFINNIIKLKEDKKISKKISENAYNCVKKKFNFSKIYSEYIKIIKS